MMKIGGTGLIGPDPDTQRHGTTLRALPHVEAMSERERRQREEKACTRS
jgi:hypothetical protein